MLNLVYKPELSSYEALTGKSCDRATDDSWQGDISVFGASSQDLIRPLGICCPFLAQAGY